MGSSERRTFDARFALLGSIDPATVIAINDRHAHSIEGVGIGGVLRIGGEEFVVEKTAVVTETTDKYKKKKGAYVSTELVMRSLKTGELRYIDWAIDDEIEISFTARKLEADEMNRRLHDDEGQPFDIDEDIDEACERKWPIMFDRKTYPFDDWWSFIYESSDGRQERGCMYEFGSKSKGWLTIEGWKDAEGKWDYEGYLSDDIVPGSIEVISTGQTAKAT